MKNIADQFFPNPKDDDNKICSVMEQKLDDKVDRKINFNISTLVVTEVLHELIDSIFRNSTITSCFKNPNKISSGEINSYSECSTTIDFNQNRYQINHLKMKIQAISVNIKHTSSCHESADWTISVESSPSRPTYQMEKLKLGFQHSKGVILMYLQGKYCSFTTCFSRNDSGTVSFLKPLSMSKSVLESLAKSTLGFSSVEDVTIP